MRRMPAARRASDGRRQETGSPSLQVEVGVGQRIDAGGVDRGHAFDVEHDPPAAGGPADGVHQPLGSAHVERAGHPHEAPRRGGRDGDVERRAGVGHPVSVRRLTVSAAGVPDRQNPYASMNTVGRSASRTPLAGTRGAPSGPQSSRTLGRAGGPPRTTSPPVPSERRTRLPTG